MAELKPPYVHTAPDRNHQVFAIRSLIAGLISLVVWLLPELGMLAWLSPMFGVAIALIGLVLGIVGWGSSRRSMAIAGIVTSLIGLVLQLLSSTLGANLAATGR